MGMRCLANHNEVFETAPPLIVVDSRQQIIAPASLTVEPQGKIDKLYIINDRKHISWSLVIITLCLNDFLTIEKPCHDDNFVNRSNGL
jgi:hypothetical protein